MARFGIGEMDIIEAAEAASAAQYCLREEMGGPHLVVVA
jgi:hypothetical protein